MGLHGKTGRKFAWIWCIQSFSPRNSTAENLLFGVTPIEAEPRKGQESQRKHHILEASRSKYDEGAWDCHESATEATHWERPTGLSQTGLCSLLPHGPAAATSSSLAAAFYSGSLPFGLFQLKYLSSPLWFTQAAAAQKAQVVGSATSHSSPHQNCLLFHWHSIQGKQNHDRKKQKESDSRI